MYAAKAALYSFKTSKYVTIFEQLWRDKKMLNHLHFIKQSQIKRVIFFSQIET